MLRNLQVDPQCLLLSSSLDDRRLLVFEVLYHPLVKLLDVFLILFRHFLDNVKFSLLRDLVFEVFEVDLVTLFHKLEVHQIQDLPCQEILPQDVFVQFRVPAGLFVGFVSLLLLCQMTVAYFDEFQAVLNLLDIFGSLS